MSFQHKNAFNLENLCLKIHFLNGYHMLSYFFIYLYTLNILIMTITKKINYILNY